MKILTNEKISPNRYKTNEGYLICVDAILARTGTQTYTRNEVFNDDSDEKIDVIREPEEVFSEMTIASFENKPVTIEHPQSFVDTKNYKDLSVGFVRDVRRSKIDEIEVIVGNLIITDSEAIQLIDDGKIYLSCGYDCDIVEEGNKIYQKNIRGNHVAICDNPRAGITKIIDSTSLNIVYDSIDKVIQCIQSIDSTNYSPTKLLVIEEMLTQIREKKGE